MYAYRMIVEYNLPRNQCDLALLCNKLDLFENWLYWLTQEDKPQLVIMSKFGIGEVKVVRSNLGEVMALSIYQPMKYNLSTLNPQGTQLSFLFL